MDMDNEIIPSPQKASKAGRKSKYTPRLVNKIVEFLKKGNNQHDSAIMAGISEDTYYTWMNEKPEFNEAVKKALAFNVSTRIERISKHGLTNWQADAWYLERMYPQRFALKTVTQHTGKVDNEITIRIVPDIPHGISDKQLKQIENSYIEGQTVEGPQASTLSKDFKRNEIKDNKDGGSGFLEGGRTNAPEIENPQEGQPEALEGPKIDEISQTRPIVSYNYDEDDE